MAYSYLKNAGILHSDNVDFAKNRAVRLASEKIGKDLYRQVHRITFVKKSGQPIVAITVSDASHIECSMSDVDVYVVSERLGAKEKSK